MDPKRRMDHQGSGESDETHSKPGSGWRLLLELRYPSRSIGIRRIHFQRLAVVRKRRAPISLCHVRLGQAVVDIRVVRIDLDVEREKAESVVDVLIAHLHVA